MLNIEFLCPYIYIFAYATYYYYIYYILYVEGIWAQIITYWNKDM
jgi:hypothetical protein